MLLRFVRYFNDRCKPLPNPGGRESEEVYFNYQYRNTEYLFRNLYSRHVDFADKEVLDLGCGFGGRTTWYAVNSGCRSIIGVDIDRYSLSVANRESPRIKAQHPIRFQEIPPSRLPFQDKSFDIVVCDETLEHVADPLTLLRECKRVLRTGGYLCMSIGPLYYSALGAHLYDYINFRWPHLFLPKRVIADLVRSLPEKRHKFTHDRAIETFLTLNKFTPGKYRRVFSQLGMRQLHMEHYRDNRLLGYVPLLNRYFLKSIFCIFQKYPARYA